MADVVIFGAGKIARGFLGQLVFRSGLSFAFVEQSQALVALMREKKGYQVRVLGAPEKDDYITGFDCCALGDRECIRGIMKGARLLFTAVGGKNLEALAPALGFALSCALEPVNVVTCENWQSPAALLEGLAKSQYPDVKAGFAEAVVMRSAIEPTQEELRQDPLLVNVQDYWHLPVDAEKLVAPLPSVLGLEPVKDFGGLLERKFYTYNAANGTVSFLGALLGHRLISEAAEDPRIAQLLEAVYLETGNALCRKYGMPLEEQLAFAGTSRAKLRDKAIVDYIERNARDPLRKLGPHDRLVGPARLCEAYGVEPEALALAIAAAIHYVQPTDPSAVQLQQMLKQDGAAGVLEKVCQIMPDEALHQLVLNQEDRLKEMQWIKE